MLRTEDDRSQALRMLAEHGYRLNDPGRIVVRMSPLYDQPAVAFAIMPDVLPSFTEELADYDPRSICCTKVYLEWIEYRLDRRSLYVYTHGAADLARFEAFVRAGDPPSRVTGREGSHK